MNNIDNVLLIILFLLITVLSCVPNKVEYVRINWHEEYIDSVTYDTVDDYIIENAYIDGDLYSSSSKAEGEWNGWTYVYYDNGNVNEKSLYSNNLPYGSSFYYYKNGNKESYFCADFHGNIRRVKKYDSLGNLIEDKGSIIAQAMINSSNFKIKNGSNVNIDVIICTPFNESITGYFVYNDVDTIYNIPIYYNTATFNRKVNKKGEHKLAMIVQSIDTVTGKKYNDTNILYFEVY